MKVYISGPMTGIPEYNYPAFEKAYQYLISKGYDVVSPHHNEIIPEWKWEDYMKKDIRLLSECDAVALLSGWENSRGAKLEVYIANMLNYDVKELSEY
jgi:hypothetical protein